MSILIATSALFTVKSGVTFGTTLSSDKLKLALAMFMVVGGALIPIEQRSRKVPVREAYGDLYTLLLVYLPLYVLVMEAV